MQFYEVETTYQTIKKRMKEKHKKITDSELEFYHQILDLGETHALGKNGYDILDMPNRDGNTIVAMTCEEEWYRWGKPYFKIWPEMADMMGDISIDIPVTALKLPYESFAIRLADDDSNSFVDPNGPRLKWIMVYEVVVEKQDDVGFKINKQSLKSASNWSVSKFSSRVKLGSGLSKALWLNYCFNNEWRGVPNAFNYTLSMDEKDGTIEEFFQKSWNRTADVVKSSLNQGEYNPSFELVQRIIKLAIATCFFGIDNHEYVLPDLPRKKLERRIHRNNSVKSALSELKKERENTKYWTIGREISLPLPISLTTIETHKNERNALKNAYARRGHMRLQPCGPNRSERKLVFVHPHIVRSDLAFKDGVGYRIPNPE